MALPVYAQQINELQNKARESLPNPYQKKLFDEISRRRVSMDLDSMARAAAQQTIVWQNETSNAVAKAFSNQIIDNRNDPEKVTGLINNIKGLRVAQASLMGQDATVAANKASAEIDSGLQDAIWTEAHIDPANAERLYNQYAPHMSTDQARERAKALFMPQLQERQVNAAYTDLSTKFNPSDPNVNPNDALNYVRDPKNYAGQITDAQRTTVANTFLGDWHRAGEIARTNQAATDSSFVDAINKNQIGNAEQFNSWKDPATGLPASPKLVQSAIDRSTKTRPANTAEYRQTLVDLSDAVSNRGLTDSTPINQAFLDGKIDKSERANLLGLQDKMQHPEKDPWFKQAESMYKDRYGAGNADAHALYPQFINNLQQNIQEQGLKGHQIYEIAQKMLQDVDKAVVNRYWFKQIPDTGQPAQATQSQNQQVPIEPGAEAWIKKSMSGTSHPATDANIRAAYEQLKAQDPEFYKHWKIGD
jgi:hypothetical protein